MLIAAVVSLLLHVLALLFLIQQKLNEKPPVETQQQPITVRLNPRVPVQAEATPPISIPEPAPELPSAKIAKVKPKPPDNPRSVQRTITAPSAPVSIPVPAPATPPVAPPVATSGPPTDMLAYVNAARERRQNAEAEAARINADAIARENAPAVQPQGTNGIFQIISKDNRTAQISFRGWKNEFSYSRREVYAVDAGLNGNIDRAIVRKMIEIIRRYYNGDFNWESPRLGRVVVLSARIEDNDGLEDFLMQEFFITGTGR
jgi:hypothetical protein